MEIDFTNDSHLLSLLESQYKNIENGLLFGKAGLALFYARKSVLNKQYASIYNRLINDVLSTVNDNTPIEFSRGLLGIGFAIDIILKYYKKGNSDYVLDEIDAMIYKSLDTNDQRGLLDSYVAIEGLFYFSLHLKYGIKGRQKRDIFIRKAESLLEYVYKGFRSYIAKEEVPWSLLSDEFMFLYSLVILYEQNIYRKRILHILNELIYEIISFTPVFQFNRLTRLFLISKTIYTIKGLIPLWKEYQNDLFSLVSQDKLLNTECRDKQIYFADGLTGIFILMEGVNKYCENRFFEIPWSYYKRRVQNSTVKEHLSKKDIPLYDMGLNGFWGINYILETRCKK